MARRGERTAAPVPGDPDDPSSWRCLVDSYLLALELKARSPATIYERRRSLARFAHWNLQHQRPRPLDITRSDVHDYEVALLHHITSSATALAVRTREQYLIAIRGFYQWLHHHNRIATDPTSHTELPTPPIQLPPRILTTDDIDHVLAQPDLTTTLGRRDSTMLELLYATGIRRTELANLTLDDIDLQRRSILIRHGKGGHDRLIPTGQRATRHLASTQRYTHVSTQHLTHIHHTSHPNERATDC